MRTKPVIFIEIVKETSVTVTTRGIAVSVSPFFSEGLDEAFGLTVSLRAVGTGEAVFDAEL